MMKMIWTFLFAVMLGATQLQAQIVDVQSQVNKKAEPGWSGAASASWDRRTGNTDIASASGQMLVRYHNDPQTVLGILKREYGQKDGESYIDNYFYHLRYQYQISDLLTWELFGQSDHNEFRGYKSRHVYGTGPLLKWVDEKDLTFYTGLAYMKEYEELTAAAVEADGKTKVDADRLSLAISYSQKPTDTLSLGMSLYYQPNIDDQGDRRLSVNAGIGFQVTDAVSYSLSAAVTHDSEPPQGIEKLDMDYKNSLNFVF